MRALARNRWRIKRPINCEGIGRYLDGAPICLHDRPLPQSAVAGPTENSLAFTVKILRHSVGADSGPDYLPTGRLRSHHALSADRRFAVFVPRIGLRYGGHTDDQRAENGGLFVLDGGEAGAGSHSRDY